MPTPKPSSSALLSTDPETQPTPRWATTSATSPAWWPTRSAPTASCRSRPSRWSPRPRRRIPPRPLPAPATAAASPSPTTTPPTSPPARRTCPAWWTTSSTSSACRTSSSSRKSRTTRAPPTTAPRASGTTLPTWTPPTTWTAASPAATSAARTCTARTRPTASPTPASPPLASRWSPCGSPSRALTSPSSPSTCISAARAARRGCMAMLVRPSTRASRRGLRRWSLLLTSSPRSWPRTPALKSSPPATSTSLPRSSPSRSLHPSRAWWIWTRPPGCPRWSGTRTSTTRTARP
ncbi:hypothetical protein UVI_02045400 [Ustilaginoidea virens]|uniref:Uncharacterized protein n=1 Tax=Ustilaginoidea virens TaxID=1159556 RepID=A0A1B5KYT0_USTVR|nr:hypothetical protein UVI_02045400 [Ustilaginoidea virens]